MSEIILQAPSLGSAEISAQDLFVGSHISSLVLKSLIELSQDPVMLESVPDDAAVRFKNQETIEQWLADAPKRIFYPLLRKSGDTRTAGLIWFTPTPEAPDASHTFSMRMYPSARGLKLGLPFMRVAHSHALHRGRDGIRSTWLKTGVNNAPARKLYQNFGYEQTGEPADGRVRMLWLPTPQDL